MTKIVAPGEQTFPSGDTAAACIAGDDPARIARPPDVTGMRHEFVIQRAHRFSYDQSFRVPGGACGPQSTGILAGRRDLIRAATLNASPNQAIGRAAKTSKEEIVGLVTALELFLAEDEKVEMELLSRDLCEHRGRAGRGISSPVTKPSSSGDCSRS